MTTRDERSKADRDALLDRRFTELVEQAIELGVPSADAEKLAENVLAAAMVSGPAGDGSFVNNEHWLKGAITAAVRDGGQHP
jgi:hypothetical protein